MATRVVYGLAILAAVVEGLWSGAVPGDLLPLAMVVLGVAYAVMNIDAANPQAFLTTALVVAAAGGADVLSNVPAVGGFLDNIVDQVAVVYLSGGAGVLGVRAWNLISKGSL
ncbi:MAG: hypothetical protein OXG59_00075 [Gammaproteobacteria bacterium]|nr:hypothetical protein [Gammaproteobacteria bacterium]